MLYPSLQTKVTGASPAIHAGYCYLPLNTTKSSSKTLQFFLAEHRLGAAFRNRARNLRFTRVTLCQLS